MIVFNDKRPLADPEFDYKRRPSAGPVRRSDGTVSVKCALCVKPIRSAEPMYSWTFSGPRYTPYTGHPECPVTERFNYYEGCYFHIGCIIAFTEQAKGEIACWLAGEKQSEWRSKRDTHRK